MAGNNLEITFSNGWTCVLSKPSKSILGLAMQKSKTDKFALGAVLLEKCWVSGDEEIKTDDGCVIGLLDFIDDLCEVKQMEVEHKGDETIVIFENNLGISIKKPNRALLNEAMTKATKNPLQFVEHILIHSSSGDKDLILADIGCLVPLSGLMDEILQKKTASLKRV